MGGPPSPPLGGAAHFNYSRVPRDRIFGIFFALVWAACIVGGIYAITHRSTAFVHTDFQDPASCPLDPTDGHRRLMELHAQHKGDFSVSDFMRLTGRWLAVSALLALGLGVAFIHLFKHHSAVMTKATVGTQVAFPAAMAIVFIVSGQPLGALMFGGLAALSAWVFYLWRDQIDLATRLLGVSAHGLAANAGIVPATICLSLGSLVAIAPLCAFLGFAFMNGEVIPNPQRQGSLQCVDAEGQDVLCCSWQPNSFARAYMGCAVVTLLWTMLLANQIRVFVTSGAVAQWYFAPSGSLTAPRGTTRLSLKHALGPSFGSLCLSSLVLTISQLIRDAMDNASRENDEIGVGTIIKTIFICLAQCCLSVLEYLTKFATVLMAVTGEAFMDAGRHVTDLLLRNLLNAFASTVWFTPLVIRLACLTMSAGWGLLSGGAYYYLHRSSALEATPGLNASVLGVSVFVVTQFVLSFIGGILLSVLDAVFICWAIDRDSQTVSHPEVYSVFQTVPIPGAVVEQPDGDIQYGAGEAAPSYQAPSSAPHAYEPPTISRV